MVKKPSHKALIRATPLQEVWHRVQSDTQRASLRAVVVADADDEGKRAATTTRTTTWTLSGSSKYDLDKDMLRIAYGIGRGEEGVQKDGDGHRFELLHRGCCNCRWTHDANGPGQVGEDEQRTPLGREGEAAQTTERARFSSVRGASAAKEGNTMVVDTTTEDDDCVVNAKKPPSKKGKEKATPPATTTTTTKDTFECSSDNCSTDPKCLNWLGQQEWEDTDKALETLASTRGIGEDPGLNLREPGVPVGLKNLGATCYANSFLQVRFRITRLLSPFSFVIQTDHRRPGRSQVWFRDPVFRNGIYACQPVPSASSTPITNSPLYHLQVLFTFLQTSVQAVYDPTPLIQSLKLDTGEQQDATEFQKLFMSLLDFEVRKAGKARGGSEGDVAGLIGSRFEGSIVYGTRCMGCNNTSERSSTFNELEVTLKANSALEARIAESLGDERMEGDNQYYCDLCQKKRDAIRYTRLDSLPPVLHFSLLRFVYSLKQGTRKKSQHSISYPQSIDMTQFVESSAGNGELWYDLEGVLMHKGVSAHHGHYVAQVFDDSSNQWYLFDDEIVTPIEDFNTSIVYKDDDQDDDEEDEDVDEIVVSSDDEYQDGSKGKAKSKSKTLEKAKAKTKGNGKGKVQVKNGSGNGKTDESSKRPKSKDAYMLVYKRRSEPPPQSQLKVIGTSEMAPAPIVVDPIPPLLALAEVQRLDDAHGKLVEEYHAKVASVKTDFESLREAKRSVYRVWQVDEENEGDAPSYAVDKRELVRWLGEGLKNTSKRDTEDAGDVEVPVNGRVEAEEPKKEVPNGVEAAAEPHSSLTEVQSSIEGLQGNEGVSMGPDGGVMAAPVESRTSNTLPSASRLSSSAIMCEHGKIDPHKVDLMKQVSKVRSCQLLVAGVEALSSLGVTLDPELEIPRHLCRDCVWSHVVEELYAVEHAEHRKAMDAAETGHDVAISKSWFKDWMREPRPKMHVPGCAADTSPQSKPYLSDVRCEHGLLRHDPKRVEQLSFEVSAICSPAGYFSMHWVLMFLGGWSDQEAAVLQSLFPDWEPIRLDSNEPCPQCAKAEAKNSKENDRMLALAKKEKVALKSFTNDTRLGGTQILLHGEDDHFLVPYAFKKQWYEWNQSISHRSVTSVRPGELDNSQLLCEHRRLLADLQAENIKLRTIHPVTSKEWKVLQDNYNAGPQIKVWQDRQTLQFLSSPASCEKCLKRQRENFATTTIKIVTIGEDRFDKEGNYKKGMLSKRANRIHQTLTPDLRLWYIHTAPADSSDSEEATILSSPPSTNGKRVPSKAQKTYGHKPVIIHFSSAGATRASARVRNQGMLYENRSATFIEMNKTDTVKALKISIYNKLSIPTICQRLFFKGQELDDSSATVEKLGVLPDMVLELFEVKEGALGLSKLEDVGDEVDRKGKRRREEGFGGTGLFGWENVGAENLEDGADAGEDPPSIDVPRKRKIEETASSSSAIASGSSRKKGRPVIIEDAEEEEEEIVALLKSDEGVACPQCTFRNASGMTQCEMCELPFN
ncbi:BQ2448_1994 [Microbotryum intermedium]|uniref:ubiquitinyl hydrolase 1 n=1 Tax=Microbotryum intermedium TaxID=269621 RepID=A0A238FAR3_9BASI|nr:BQ2448_1994 [Microbotryum intermedium]